MAVRIIKKSWWVDFRVNHTRYRKRSPENSRAGALAYEALLRQKVARGESIDSMTDAAQQTQVFERFAWQWFETYVVPNNKHSERVTKKNILAQSLIPFFGRLPVAKITSYHIEQYKAQLAKEGVKNKTIKNRLSVLNKCLVTAYDWLQLSGAPPKIRWPRCAPPQMDFLSLDECELLLSHADGTAFELILTALRTGMRQGELKGLQWPSIDWQNRTITVQHSRDDRAKALTSPKSNRIRHLPMDADVYEALYRRKRATGYVFTGNDGGPLTHHRMSRLLRHVRERAGLRQFGWHTFRHTFASHLVLNGEPLTAVKELLGHSSITTTMRYAHLAPSTLRAAIDRLNPKTRLNADFGQPVGNRPLMQQTSLVTRHIGAPQEALVVATKRHHG